MRSTIKSSALLLYLPLYIVLLWYDCLVIFTDYSFNKHDNFVAIVITLFLLFYSWHIVKRFKFIVLEENEIRVCYMLPILNQTHSIANLVSIEFEYKHARISYKNLVLNFADGSTFKICSLITGKFNKIERLLEWVKQQPGNTITNLADDFEPRLSNTRLSFDKVENSDRIFALICCYAVLFLMPSVFSLIKLIEGVKNTDMELFLIYTFTPVSVLFVLKLRSLLKKRKRLNELLTISIAHLNAP